VAQDRDPEFKPQYRGLNQNGTKPLHNNSEKESQILIQPNNCYITILVQRRQVDV
jgi:hypothetical protein